MKTLKTLIFILFISQISFGQESEKTFIIKTHPFAYLNKDYNIGVEFGKTKKLHYNIGLFATHFRPLQLFDENEDEDSNSFFGEKTKGATLRLGLKSFHKNWYLEPQIRLAKTSTIASDRELDGRFIFDASVKRTTFQLCLLGGYRIQPTNSAFVLDTYLGLGVASIKIHESKYTAHIDPSKVGSETNFGYPKSTILLYFGTSIGFDLKKMKNEK
jgi:hypothetical protein